MLKFLTGEFLTENPVGEFLTGEFLTGEFLTENPVGEFLTDKPFQKESF